MKNTKRGRPRTYSSNAARQKAFRERHKTLRPPGTDDPKGWNEYLASLGLSVDAGLYLRDAPQGKGLQHSGETILDPGSTDLFDKEGEPNGARRNQPGTFIRGKGINSPGAGPYSYAPLDSEE